MGEKRTFLGRQNFLANGVAGGSKIDRVPILAMLHTSLQGISLSMKNKKVIQVESYGMPKNQKSWLPPFGTQCLYSPDLS